MGMYAVQADDSGELTSLSTAARDGRAVARSRRMALSQGKHALNGGDRAAAAAGAGAPPAADGVHGDGAVAARAASNGQDAPNGARPAPRETSYASNGVAAAHLGRDLSKQRRRQLSQGKHALNGGADRTVAAARAGAAPAADVDGNGPVAPPAASDGQGARPAPRETSYPSNGVAAAHLGRDLSKLRRRQLSQGKQALNGGGDGAAAAAHAPPAGTGDQGTPGAPVASNGVAAAHLGRDLSKQRRRQLSQGKQALTAGGDPTAAAVGTGALPIAGEAQVDGVDWGRPQARARRAEASRYGGAGASRPQRAGRIRHAPKVIASPTQGGQQVTGLRIGPGVAVTGDEPGAALPVSGTQYVAADGAAPPGAARKVGLARTAQGLVVSGTTVRNKVPITGDEAGEHLPITGEADQKFDDDLTPRSDGAYRSTQFPRRADPHGASAVGTRLGLPSPTAASGEDGAWHPLETTNGGLPVTGTAVGRSGRVTGNEAGACRPITGDQYQHLSSSSSECGGSGGGTAPAAHLGRARLDPATGGKVTVAQTWGGQRVTGPSVEHSSIVTGDEPGVCRPVTGTPYQGPSNVFGWCESGEGDFAAQRLESRAGGVAVTGDIPMPAKAVTGTERGQRSNVTGTPYYRDMRAAEPAADDGTRWQAFSVPVALAPRLAGGESDDATNEEARKAAPPASTVPGGITGSFAIGDGKVTGNNEFLFRPRQNREAKPAEVTGEGNTDGRPITGSPAAWTPHGRVTGTEGYIAAGRNPTEGGGRPHGWAGAVKFRDLATPAGPRHDQNVTGLSGWSPKAARVTLSGGAQG